MFGDYFVGVDEFYRVLLEDLVLSLVRDQREGFCCSQSLSLGSSGFLCRKGNGHVD